MSFLILFLELALIRWVSTHLRIFAYVNNLVLLACFLGVGLGCYYAKREAYPALALAGLLALVLMGTSQVFADASLMLSVFDDEVIWFGHQARAFGLQVVLGVFASLAVFACVALILFPLGQIMGRCFSERRDLIAAYSLNVGASLLGVWAFNAVSFAFLPPWTWFGIALALLAPFLRWRALDGTLLAAAALGVFLVGAYPAALGKQIVWSPYQRLEVIPYQGEPLTWKYLMTVNTVQYMLLIDLSDATLEALRAPREVRRFGHYDLPYRFKQDAEDVLIVGSGGGNDVAGALRNGARRVTAVEIDPGIYRIAERLHPERPYSDPRVTTVIDDARAYFKRSEARYDLISFGLLDSHTMGSSLTNTRIDHYVYTRESLEEVRALLAPGGVVTLAFDVPRLWVRDRLRSLLKEVFGAEPLVFESRGPLALGWGGEMFVVGDDMPRLLETVRSSPELSELLDRRRLPVGPDSVKLTTDDWPYFYLERAAMPTLHLILSAVLVLLFVLLKGTLLPGGKRIEWHFFFLGAAFLLLEFQNISKLTLLFGSTWFVNALTISAILAFILLANLVAARWPRLDLRFAYAGLFASVLLMWLIPLSAFNALPYVWKALASCALMNLPIGFAGIIFVVSFSRAAEPELAFGSNLLGAGLGGLLESLSFVTGIKGLLLVTALLYAASWLTRRAGSGVGAT